LFFNIIIFIFFHVHIENNKRDIILPF
jgi:hypothetical protein